MRMKLLLSFPLTSALHLTLIILLIFNTGTFKFWVVYLKFTLTFKDAKK